MKPFHLITDGSALRKQGKLLSHIEQAFVDCEGLIGYVHLREQAPDDELVTIGKEILALCEKHDAKLIVNKRIDLVKQINAHGAHLNNKEAIKEALQELGKEAVIGYSAHSKQEITELPEGVSYSYLSPIFAPRSKQDARAPMGVKELEVVVSKSSIPVIALGGISPENIIQCKKAGIAGIAGISCFMSEAKTLTRIWKDN